ncbi:MAG: hypothetical protein LBI42_12815 [Chitinispirillales bacterium]|jgi:hypothetical protein|nr:hypothetical protein [Chitinispirillales bacterium]
MNRTTRKTVFFVTLIMFTVSAVFASRGILPRDIWYIGSDMKTAQAKWWTMFLGNYDLQLTRPFPGEGQVTFPASINFQFLSSGYIEGNGSGSRGPQRGILPAMLIRTENGETSTIQIANIDYIYDWGTKVALTDGRKGDFMFNMEGTPTTPKRFALIQYKMTKSSWGDEELKPTEGEGVPIVALAFSKEGAVRASKEPVSD